MRGRFVWRETRTLVLLIPVVLASLFAAATPASATTLSVCQHGCPYTQIAPAVGAATSGDTIRVGPGTYAGGITIDINLQIVGAGRATTISGGGPVVTIGSASSTPTVALANLTITGGVTTTNPESPRCGPDNSCGKGYATATALGGGIEAFPGTTVTILNSLISGNRAAPAVSVPSVVAVCPGNVPCQASFGDGAGIDDWGTMTLAGTVVSDNQSTGDQADGGGITVEPGASLSLQGSAVTDNSAVAPSPNGRFAAGGGIYVAGGGSLTVDSSSIDGNSASLSNSIPSPYPDQTGATDQENAFTGGVFLDSAPATIRNSELDGNSVTVDTPLGQAFGADAALCACGDSPLTLQNSRIEGNKMTVQTLSSDANGPSGPGAFEIDANAMITNVSIVDNDSSITSAHSDAGDLGAVGSFFGGTVTPTFTNSIIADNTAVANAPNGAATVQGAGLTNNGPLLLQNVVVRDNEADAQGQSGFAEGAGIMNGPFGPTSPLTLVNSSVTANTLSGTPAIVLQGAGIYTQGFPVTLINSVIAHNTPDQCFGC